MRNIWSKLKNIKKNRYLILIPILVLLAVIIPNETRALLDIGNIAENTLMAPVHTILLAIVGMLGALMQVVMYLFVAIAQYDGFATANAISLGWAMIRDLCNMVIVVYLLYTAFMYALGQGHVELDKSLVNLVLVAIGVNFSKTITLLLVDVSQVVMLTFVNSFKNIGVAELYRIMNVGSFFTLSDKPVSTSSALATEFFTIIIMLVVLTVIGLFMAILVVRVVMIWLHIVLSPIYVAGFGVSWLKGYHDTWWKEMKEYLIIGPCLAFFIWLTFASLQQTTSNALVPDPTKFENLKNTATATASLGEIGTVDRISGLIVALALLLGGVSLCSKYASSSAFPIGGFDKKLKDWSTGVAKSVSGYNRVEGAATSFGKGLVKGGGERAYNNRFLRQFTERGRKESDERTAARAQGIAGGKWSARALQNVQEKQQEAKSADFKMQGAMDNKGEFKKRYDLAIKEGNAEDVKALMDAGADKGWLDDKMFEEGKTVISSSFGLIAGASGWARDKAKGYGATEKDLDQISGLGIARGSRERADKAQIQFLNKIAKKSTNPLDAGVKTVDGDTGEIIEGAKTKGERLKEKMKKMSLEDIKKTANTSDSLMGDNAADKISGMANKAEQMGKLDQDERDKVKTQLDNLKKQDGFLASLTEEEGKEMEKLYEAVTAKWDSSGSRSVIDGVTDKGGSIFADSGTPAMPNIDDFENTKEGNKKYKAEMKARQDSIDASIKTKAKGQGRNKIEYDQAKQDTANLLDHSKASRGVVQGVVGLGAGMATGSMDKMLKSVKDGFSSLRRVGSTADSADRASLQNSSKALQSTVLNDSNIDPLIDTNTTALIDQLFTNAKANFTSDELGRTVDLKDPRVNEMIGEYELVMPEGESITRAQLLDKVKEQIINTQDELGRAIQFGSTPQEVSMKETQLRRQMQDAVLMLSPNASDNKKYAASNSFTEVPPARIEVINKNLTSAKGAGNEIAAINQIDMGMAELSAMYDEMRNRGGNLQVIEQERNKLETIRQRFESDPNAATNIKIEALKEHNDETIRMMKTKGFFATEV